MINLREMFERAIARAVQQSLDNGGASQYVGAAITLVNGVPTITSFYTSDFYDSAVVAIIRDGKKVEL